MKVRNGTIFILNHEDAKGTKGAKKAVLREIQKNICAFVIQMSHKARNNYIAYHLFSV